MTSSFPRTLRLGMCAILLAAFAASFIPGNVSTASAASYDPLKAISDDNMRDFDSMSEKEIQEFLDSQAGPLKSLTTKDYAGKQRTAAAIIYQAAQVWKINPKVILVTLQKEQSLIESPVTPYTLKYRLQNATGCGVYDSDGDGKIDRKWPDFGLQIYHCARSLDNYGEGKTQTHNGVTYKPILGTTRFVAGTTRYKIYDYSLKKKTYIKPKNIATFKLYVYTPYSSGPKTTATLYNRYFGSPLASARYKPVYLFKSKKTGSYYYTDSVAKKVSLTTSSSKKKWTYKGVTFKEDTQVAKSDTVPVYRFQKKSNGKYYYTTSKSKYEARRSKNGRKTWRYSGIAFRVSKSKASGSYSIYRFQNKKTGATLFTANKEYKNKLRTKKYKKTWSYKGVYRYLPRD